MVTVVCAALSNTASSSGVPCTVPLVLISTCTVLQSIQSFDHNKNACMPGLYAGSPPNNLMCFTVVQSMSFHTVLLLTVAPAIFLPKNNCSLCAFLCEYSLLHMRHCRLHTLS